MNVDGWVIIGTKVDTKGFNKDMRTLDQQIRQVEKQHSDLLKQRQEIQETLDNAPIAKEYLQEEYDNLRRVATSKEDINELTAQEKVLMEALDAGVEDYQKQLEEVDKQINQNLATQKELKRQLEFREINKNVQNVGKSISGVITRVVKWGLALFGITGVLSFISSSMSTLSNYNKQLGTDIQYIRFALATTMEPLIKRLIDLAYKLLAYINYIAKAWFNVNLFAGASAKRFSDANGSASKLRKTLASFDEMNVLSDNQSGGGVGTPSFDFAKDLNDIPIPEWVKWIADNKDEIFTIAEVVAGLFAVGTIAKWASNIMGFINGPLTLLGTSLGQLGIIAGGVVITYLCAKQVWDDIKKLKEELDNIAEHGEEGTKKWLEKETDMNKVLQNVNVQRQGGLDTLKESKNVASKVLGTDESKLKIARKQTETAQLQFEKLIEQYNQGKLTEEQQKQLTEELKKQLGYNMNITTELEEHGLNTRDVRDRTQELAGMLDAVETNTKYSKDETQQWKEEQDGVYRKVDGTYYRLKDIDNVHISNKNVNVNVNESKWNKFVKKVKEFFGITWHISFEGSSGGGHSGGGAHGAKGMIVSRRLASGGVIINQPGRGVPVGSAIGGERGMEAVVPLTDSQQMALLGEAIGKYITINANIVNMMNGRIISKELRRIQNDEDFAFNR